MQRAPNKVFSYTKKHNPDLNKLLICKPAPPVFGYHAPFLIYTIKEISLLTFNGN